jgi:hypothetical protein
MNAGSVSREMVLSPNGVGIPSPAPRGRRIGRRQALPGQGRTNPPTVPRATRSLGVRTSNFPNRPRRKPRSPHPRRRARRSSGKACRQNRSKGAPCAPRYRGSAPRTRSAASPAEQCPTTAAARSRTGYRSHSGSRSYPGSERRWPHLPSPQGRGRLSNLQACQAHTPEVSGAARQALARVAHLHASI